MFLLEKCGHVSQKLGRFSGSKCNQCSQNSGDGSDNGATKIEWEICESKLIKLLMTILKPNKIMLWLIIYVVDRYFNQRISMGALCYLGFNSLCKRYFTKYLAFLGIELAPLLASVTAGLYPHWNVTYRSRYVCLHNTHVLWSITDTCLYETFQVTHPLISVRCNEWRHTPLRSNLLLLTIEMISMHPSGSCFGWFSFFCRATLNA